MLLLFCCQLAVLINAFYTVFAAAWVDLEILPKWSGDIRLFSWPFCSLHQVFVCGCQQVNKKGLDVKWLSVAMRDLSKVKGFSVLADLTLADSTAMHCQHLLNSLFSFFTLAFCFFLFFPPLVIACLSQIFNFSLLLPFPTFSWICLVCTFPTVHCFHVALYHFLSLQSCWIFLTASCRMPLPSYGLCYLCLTQTKGFSSGLKASQVSPSFLPSPGTFRLTANRFT